MEALAIAKEVAIILLVVSAAALGIFAIVGLVRLFPHLRRLVENLSVTTASTAKVDGDLASVSSDITADVKKTTAAVAEASENLVKGSKISSSHPLTSGLRCNCWNYSAQQGAPLITQTWVSAKSLTYCVGFSAEVKSGVLIAATTNLEVHTWQPKPINWSTRLRSR